MNIEYIEKPSAKIRIHRSELSEHIRAVRLEMLKKAAVELLKN